jgi:uncharacterized damage-inducible protein DinB
MGHCVVVSAARQANPEQALEFQTIEPFITYLESVHRRTRTLADYIPGDQVEWSPGEGRFTPGDLVRHIAGTERWMWGENAQLLPSKYPGHGVELASGKSGVLDYMDRLHADMLDILKGLPPERLNERYETVGGVEMRVWKWLRLMIEHEIHHRGQLYELLGQMGVETPPLYGLTEPEVLERSEG